jgi:DmsE family decaheme c-type cytochrome
MQCSSCHQVHGSPERQLRTEERANDLCLQCHTAKQGPFVFEHPPVVDNCLTCHEPHGTIANNLLRQNEPFLCLQCHEAHFHVGRSGATGPVSLPSGGSTNPYGEKGWRTAFGTKCSECHSQVHGTDLPGQSVPGRGRSLIR